MKCGNSKASDPKSHASTHLVDVLALELSDELVELGGVGLDANNLKEGLDVGGGGGGVATLLEEEVSGEVLHLGKC